MHYKNLFLPLLAILLATCGAGEAATSGKEMTEDKKAVAQEAEVLEWVDLFDGKSFTGWHRYGGEPVGSAWKIQDGAMWLDSGPDDDGHTEDGGGDIVTNKAYGNYELELEWRISECGNSGIIYNVQESDEYAYPWMTGPEMQVLDNSCHPDAKFPTHRAGDLYDIQSVQEENPQPVGQWNRVKLVVTDGEAQHWMNGVKQVVYQNTGESWSEKISNSKFKDMDKWGTFTEGKICLQDHGDPVWYRNIRIRQLNN